MDNISNTDSDESDDTERITSPPSSPERTKSVPSSPSVPASPTNEKITRFPVLVNTGLADEVHSELVGPLRSSGIIPKFN